MPHSSWVPNKYPPTRRSDHVETYESASRGKVSVPDPYQWLESDSDETESWTTAQEAFTREYLDRNPELERLKNAFQNCVDYPKFYAPHLFNDGRWYWFYNSGLDPQTALYRSRDGTLPDFSQMQDTDFELYFDPNALSSDGTASLSTYSISKCGKYFAYLVSHSGSDFVTVYVRHTSTPLTKDTDLDNDPGRLPEEIKFVKFSNVAWTPDSSGFFYQRFPDPAGSSPDESKAISTQSDLDAMIYFHRLGTPQTEDILIHKDDKNRDCIFGFGLTEDGKYLVLYTSKNNSHHNLLWIADFDSSNIGPNIIWNKVINDYDATYEVVTNIGSRFYMRTNKSAPKYKIETIDIAEGRKFDDLVLETDANLSSASCVNKENLVITYQRNVTDEVYIFSMKGEQIIRLADSFVGSASVSCRDEYPWLFVHMSGFTSPGTIGLYDFSEPAEKRWSIYRTTKLNGLNPDEFEAHQVWYSSKDGTKIPMFIVRHKSTKFDGRAPALLYGYGGFNVSVNPFFSAMILTFIKHYGVVFAVPNIRGGGEFGEEWHLAGCREKKSNCFDDFIGATNFLVKNKYAAPDKVSIRGGSNGGLLVAACVNRAPEGTFGCALAEVGVHDMLKFHKFTIGKAWVSDYGDPENPNDFDFIQPYSPIHNVQKDKVLPPYLLLTADHDDRVVPMHSFKLAATLQHTASHNPYPLLLRVEKKAGHGAGKSTQQLILESADKYGFIVQSLGLGWTDQPTSSNS